MSRGQRRRRKLQKVFFGPGGRGRTKRSQRVRARAAEVALCQEGKEGLWISRRRPSGRGRSTRDLRRELRPAVPRRAMAAKRASRKRRRARRRPRISSRARSMTGMLLRWVRRVTGGVRAGRGSEAKKVERTRSGESPGRRKAKAAPAQKRISPRMEKR
jgi:hypothetical protein